MTPAEVLAAVRAQYDALTETQAKLVALSRVEDAPLDPEQPDDAAVLLRGETLVLGGASGSQALAQARGELVAYCETCRRSKRVLRRPDMPGLAWPVCGHQPVHVEREDTVTFNHFLSAKGDA